MLPERNYRPDWTFDWHAKQARGQTVFDAI
jgi:hypothetical protein